MRIAIERPQLTEVNFHQLLDIYKQQITEYYYKS